MYGSEPEYQAFFAVLARGLSRSISCSSCRASASASAVSRRGRRVNGSCKHHHRSLFQECCSMFWPLWCTTSARIFRLRGHFRVSLRCPVSGLRRFCCRLPTAYATQRRSACCKAGTQCLDVGCKQRGNGVHRDRAPGWMRLALMRQRVPHPLLQSTYVVADYYQWQLSCECGKPGIAMTATPTLSAAANLTWPCRNTIRRWGP